MTMITTVQPATILTMQRRAVVLLARLRRVLNGWAAAAIARRERQASLFALRLDDREPDYTRLYDGPIDEVFEKVVRLRKLRRLKQP